MLPPIHDYRIINGNLVEKSNWKQISNIICEIYEVIRVIDGVVLFLEDHITRFLSSLEISNIDYVIDEMDLELSIYQLIQANGVKEGNIYFALVQSDDENTMVVHFIEHFYPTQEMYSNGVSVCLLQAERNNPNAKVVQQELRAKVQNIKNEKQVFEVVLVNENVHITEGSKSNLFFVRGNTLVTAPIEEILEGITRKYIIYCAKSIGFDVQERFINKEELSDFEVAFLSGTSLKILPVSTFENIDFELGNRVLKKLMVEFEKYLNNHIREQKAIFGI